MGFSIWAADDPELDSDEESGSPHFSASRQAMTALRDEMEKQGIGRVLRLAALEFNDGEHVGIREIAAALEVASDDPETADDMEMRELWLSWLAFLRVAVAHGGICVY